MVKTSSSFTVKRKDPSVRRTKSLHLTKRGFPPSRKSQSLTSNPPLKNKINRASLKLRNSKNEHKVPMMLHKLHTVCTIEFPNVKPINQEQFYQLYQNIHYVIETYHVKKIDVDVLLQSNHYILSFGQSKLFRSAFIEFIKVVVPTHILKQIHYSDKEIHFIFDYYLTQNTSPSKGGATLYNYVYFLFISIAFLYYTTILPGVLHDFHHNLMTTIDKHATKYSAQMNYLTSISSNVVDKVVEDCNTPKIDQFNYIMNVLFPDIWPAKPIKLSICLRYNKKHTVSILYESIHEGIYKKYQENITSHSINSNKLNITNGSIQDLHKVVNNIMKHEDYKSISNEDKEAIRHLDLELHKFVKFSEVSNDSSFKQITTRKTKLNLKDIQSDISLKVHYIKKIQSAATSSKQQDDYEDIVNNEDIMNNEKGLVLFQQPDTKLKVKTETIESRFIKDAIDIFTKKIYYGVIEPTYQYVQSSVYTSIQAFSKYIHGIIQSVYNITTSVLEFYEQCADYLEQNLKLAKQNIHDFINSYNFLSEFLADISRLLYYLFHSIIPLLILVIRLFFDFRNAKKNLLTNTDSKKDNIKDKDKDKKDKSSRISKKAWLDTPTGGSSNNV